MHRYLFTEWTLTIIKKNAATSIFVVYDIKCKIIDALQGQFWENQYYFYFFFTFFCIVILLSFPSSPHLSLSLSLSLLSLSPPLSLSLSLSSLSLSLTLVYNTNCLILQSC